MAKTSVHFQPCKEISEIHNYRKKKLDYVRTQVTNKNENWMWDSSKSLADRREEIRKLVRKRQGEKCKVKPCLYMKLWLSLIIKQQWTTLKSWAKSISSGLELNVFISRYIEMRDIGLTEMEKM